MSSSSPSFNGSSPKSQASHKPSAIPPNFLHITQSRSVGTLAIQARGLGAGEHFFDSHLFIRDHNIFINLGGIPQDLRPAADKSYSTDQLLDPQTKLVWQDKNDKFKFIDRLKAYLKQQTLAGVALWFDDNPDGYGHYMAALVYQNFITPSHPELIAEEKVYRVTVPPKRGASSSPPRDRYLKHKYQEAWNERLPYSSAGNLSGRLVAESIFFRDEVLCRVAFILSRIQREALIAALPDFEINRFPSIPFEPQMSSLLMLILMRYKDFIARNVATLYDLDLLEEDMIRDGIGLPHTRRLLIDKLLQCGFIAKLSYTFDGGEGYQLTDFGYVPCLLGATLAEWYTALVPNEGIRQWNTTVQDYMERIRSRKYTRDEALTDFLDSNYGRLLVDPALDAVQDLRDALSGLDWLRLFDPLPLDRMVYD